MPTQPPFHASRFTIFIKLITIVTVINGCALGVMTLLATIFFHAEAQRRVLENNLNIAEVIGSKIRSQLASLRGMSRLMGQQIELGGEFTDASIFGETPGTVMFGVMGQEKFHVVTNRSYLEKNELLESELVRVVRAAGLESLSEAPTVRNISRELSVPLLLVIYPFKPGSVALAVIDANEVVGSFQPIGLTRTFMVNSEGVLISSSDAVAVVSADVMTKVPIVEAMLKSPVLTGELLYEDGGIEYLGTYRRLDVLGLGVISTVQADKIFEVVYHIQRRNILFTLVILNVSFIIVFFFSRTLTAPIKGLVRAMEMIKQGNFQVAIRPVSGDEIGRLTDSLASMAQGLMERNLIKEAFGKFVNKEVAERVIRGDLRMDGERIAECVVFFSDLRNFTAMCENMEPESVLAYLNAYFHEMVRCVHETGGVVDKFIGDAIMAHWGAVTKSENDIERAVNAALLMRAALRDLNTNLAKKGFPSASFGCGINAGPVISGQIGSMDRLEFTIVGDAVNVASRIEGLNKPFGTDILISEDAYHKVRPIYRVKKMPTIMLKGKTGHHFVYAILGRFDDDQSAQSLTELRMKLNLKFDAGGPIVAEGEAKFKVVAGGHGI